MIWIVSKKVSISEKELANRHIFIEDITQANVSPWLERTCVLNRFPKSTVGFYQCTSDKGEYGFMITAHIDEVPAIVKNVLTSKRALVVVNSCIVNKNARSYCLNIVKAKNAQSELFFAKQKVLSSGALVNVVNNAGTFRFGTTASERELFMHREEGLIKAIRVAFDKVGVE